MIDRSGPFYDPAPEGTVYVCGACGKRAKTRAGVFRDGTSSVLSHGWDESCFMWAVLCKEGGPPWQAVTPPE